LFDDVFDFMLRSSDFSGAVKVRHRELGSCR
jgi:hypothetical protein